MVWEIFENDFLFCWKKEENDFEFINVNYCVSDKYFYYMLLRWSFFCVVKNIYKGWFIFCKDLLLKDYYYFYIL